MTDLRATQLHTLRVFAREQGTLGARDMASALGITERSAGQRCWRLVASGHLLWIEGGRREPRFVLSHNGRKAVRAVPPSQSQSTKGDG